MQHYAVLTENMLSLSCLPSIRGDTACGLPDSRDFGTHLPSCSAHGGEASMFMGIGLEGEGGGSINAVGRRSMSSIDGGGKDY